MIPIVWAYSQIAKLGGPFTKFSSTMVGMITATDRWLTSVLKTNEAADEGADAFERLSAAIRGSKQEADVVKAYEDMLKSEKEATSKYGADMTKTMEDAYKDLNKANAKYTGDVAKINAKLSGDLADYAHDFAKTENEARDKHIQEHVKVVREGNEEIIRIRQNHQAKLEELEREHNQNVQDLLGDRDALGLVEEERRYQDELAAANKEVSAEIRRRRQETATKLQEMDVEYAQEKAKRLVDYLEKVNERKLQAEQEKAERLKEYEEEKKEIRLQRAEKLRELQIAHREEIIRIRQAFIDRVRDLNAALLGETELKRRHYAMMLNDAQAFVDAYRRKMNLGSIPTGTQPVPGKAGGGYSSGVVNTGEVGPEFILSHSTTKAAERAVKGSLNQKNVLGAIAGAQQTINIELSHGVTFLQIKRMLKEFKSTFAQELAEGLGG
jgi:hypothetical protein